MGNGRVMVWKEDGEGAEKRLTVSILLDHLQNQIQLYLVQYGGKNKKTESRYLHTISSWQNRYSNNSFLLLPLVNISK